jgi:hypothetical protein
MILINKVTPFANENYYKDLIECLYHNSEISFIKTIVVFYNNSNIILPNNNKVKLIVKNGYTDYEIIEYCKSIYKNEVFMFSNPFVKFNNTLINLDRPLGKTIKIDNDCYIFNRNTNIKKSGNIESLFEFYESSNKINLDRKQIWSDNLKSSDLFEKDSSRSARSINIRNVQKKEQYLKRKAEVVKPISPKIDAIIVSVDYNDFLSITLESTSKLFNVTVVTSPNDKECQELCEKYNVNCVISERIYENGAIFNKGKAINDGIKSLKNPEWILLLDADIYVKSDFSDVLKRTDIRPKNLLICKRLIVEDYDSFIKWKLGEEVGSMERAKGFGYFQMFNINKFRKNDIIFPEDSDDASFSDLTFRDKFSKNEIEIDTYVVHLGRTYQNWKGRKTDNFVESKKIEIVEKSKFKICSYYFNFKNDSRQKNNLIKFLDQFNGRYEDVIIGLIDYDDIDFEIPCESVIIKGDNNNKLWSKELLINKIIDKVDTDYLIWIDADLIYENLDWLNNIDLVAKDNDFVQLFENINYLGENNEVLESRKSIISGSDKNIDKLLLNEFKPGGSWLGKVSILKEKKLFEKMYVGGGDTIFVYGLFGVNNGYTLEKVGEGSKQIKNEAIEWINNFGNYKVGYLKETINHLYHGDIKDRNYNDRYKSLSKIDIYLKKQCSIIIPAYKAKEFLLDCIVSITNQAVDIDVEILIGIDNCQETKEYIESNKFILKNCKIFYFEENSGPYLIRNTLVSISKYENIIFFDADDIMCDGLINRTIEYLSKYESVRWMFENFYGEINNREINKYHAHGVFAIKKEKIIKINGFQPWRIGADSEFLERSKINGINIFYDDEICFYRRQHDNNQTRNKTTGTGSPARLEVQEKLKKMRKEKNFPNPEILNIKKFTIENETHNIN